MMRKLFLHLFARRSEHVGLWPGCLAGCLAGLPQQMWISKDEYELFESVEPILRRARECAVGLAVRRQVTGGVFVPDHPHCHSTALDAFSFLSRR